MPNLDSRISLPIWAVMLPDSSICFQSVNSSLSAYWLSTSLITNVTFSSARCENATKTCGLASFGNLARSSMSRRSPIA
jgi:hypothetical protein